ncbi:putative metalloprotease CJM1_0395 family protein [Psychromonas antarctica]|uniref:putative metalloprotease CJM1_0395 family protein n=1 Tax=Psychromonas antarctica TaxID=67573 RepID=UPI001EE97092|nr:putative metalloprotease CJM1_0395 family protein [Psychromonas antarctica]MCG6200573.1 hypothetical protein [Psychromonas antarctica]
MNISANSGLLQVLNRTPVLLNKTEASNIASDHSVTKTNPITSSTPPVAEISDISSQSSDKNITYDRAINKRSENSDLGRENSQQSDSPNSIESQNPQSTERNVTKEDQPDGGDQAQYSDLELKQISNLKSRDTEVEAHERAHSAVGGQHAGSPSYSYQTGPDGVKYAVSGEVSIDTSRVPNDPQATLRKATQIKAAALAPAEPSSQDKRVAAKADQIAAQARSDIFQEQQGNGRKTNISTANYETSVPEHFASHQYLAEDNLAKDNDIQKELNVRIQQIKNLYQNSSTDKIRTTFQTEI